MGLLWSRDEPGPDASPLDLHLWELAQEVFARHGHDTQLKLTPERLPILTFHGFCAQLLKLAPQEAGVPLEFTLLEEDETRWLQAESLEELRRRLNARPPTDPLRQALIRRLVRLNNDWPRLGRELQGLLSRRDSLGDFLALARITRDPDQYRGLLEERFRMALQPSLEDLRAALAGSDLGQAWEAFRQAVQGSEHGKVLPAALPGSGVADLAAWQAVAQVLLTKQGEPRKRLSTQDGFPQGLNQQLWRPLLQALPPAAAGMLKQCRDLTPTGASPEEAAALQDLVMLMGEAWRIYEQLCSRKGALDFVALEAATLNLLGDDHPTDIMLRLDWRLKHLLVDEFQDTSENQMQLLCRLLAGWQAGEGRSLMVVGDPKQSIYGWRQAKPRLFMASRAGLPCSAAAPWPLTAHWLATNFRSTRTLIEWANGVFGSTIMRAGTAGARFHPAAARPGAPVGPAPSLALFTGETDRSARELEARWLAGQVAQTLPTLPGDAKVAILLFNRTHLPRYLKALYEAGLSVRVREGLKLAASRTVAHLHNLTRALVRPQDDVAWAAVLRGPWGCQTLAILAQVAQTPGAAWPEKLRRFSQGTDCPRDLAALIQSLDQARGQVGRRPLADILAAWLDRTQSWAAIAGGEGPPGVANARSYLDLLAAAEAGLPEATWSRADFNLAEAFQPPDPRAQASPVEILTVHGAKGLEFHQVFLPFLDWQPLKSDAAASPFLLEEIPGTRRHGLALARPYTREKQSSLYLLLQDIKNRRLVDEARRVFYVAVTRAQQRLVMSGLAKTNKTGTWRNSGHSPLAWLAQHYGQDLPPPGEPVIWTDPALQVEHVAAVPPCRVDTGPTQAAAPPWEFAPEPAPYEVSLPSRLADSRIETPAPGPGEAPGEGDTARLRGEIMHRALETLVQQGCLPEITSLAAALRQAGMDAGAAAALAPEIRSELEACRRDPFLAALVRPEGGGAASEWLLEDQPQPGVIRRGVMDLLAFDGQDWWIVDYKTSRPAAGEDWDTYVTRETARYRPQLLAYREMAAKAKGLAPPEVIRLALYFTAAQRAVTIAS
jgi:ATP-dependent exoDNAse (exonuclease V) beta subunit